MTRAADEIRKELQQLNLYLLECEKRIHKGEILDMSNFDEKTRQLCERLVHLPRETATELAPELQALISRLDRVGSKLENH
tara:strand:+ start:1063 stop:1305 length:243 start_codon:yes stop_codon:yes gene_type:complete